MSYILDALKKSELERAQKAQQQTEFPASQNQTQPPAQFDERSRETSWALKAVYLLLAVLSVLVLLKIFEVPRESVYLEEAERELSAVEEIVVEAKLIEAELIQVKKVVPAKDSFVEKGSIVSVEKQSSQDSSIINKESVVKASVTNTANSEAGLAVLKDTAIAIEQAPKEVLNQLPTMSISSHIYSTQADRRSIVVNDQRLVEGDFVSPGVQVKQITNQGMIVQVQGRLLVVSRSRGWGL